ncbi:FAD-dependent oxidoreductase domain-containing protein 2-like [Liolophura sinensis]|uniref:FAD-dependent oxidoreductase domain-containing protein 2-like n=1 Tax=Liolophura sinensis TaxID=3198878 RepID=UPI00315802FE
MLPAIAQVLVLGITSLLSRVQAEPHPGGEYHKYCIIGAGPGGLQLAYFLERANRDYIIFEKSNTSGNFYVTYPRHRTLISINKRNTGKTNKEFNLRHDWNSLISDDESLLLRHYTKSMWPHADLYVKYLNDYQRKLGLKVQFNTEISNIEPPAEEGGNFTMADQRGQQYSCRILTVATGIWKPNLPMFKGIELTEGYEDISTNPEDYEGQTVLILGRGNAAFETADSIYGHTNLVHMVARSRVRLSWATHYVGDLRAVNNAVLDTYQLKSLDAVLEAPIEEVQVIKRNGKLYLVTTDDEESAIDNFAMREPYDRIIRCLGFNFDSSIFKNSSALRMGVGRKKKYPMIKYNYESSTIPNLFFAGTNTHSLDFRKSAGGFIHGFRYTVRATHRYMEWKYHGVQWPSVQLPITELLSCVLKRINEASGPYQMFGILGDIFLLTDNGRTFEHIEEFPINMLHEFSNITGKPTSPMIVLVLEYGANFSGPGKDIFRLNRATGEPAYAFQSNFLHPVFYYYSQLPTELDMQTKSKFEILPRPDRIHHIVEDFLTTWDAPVSHILPLRRFLEYTVGMDLRSFFADACFQMTMMYATVPAYCQVHYLHLGQGLFPTVDLAEAASTVAPF